MCAQPRFRSIGRALATHEAPGVGFRSTPPSFKGAYQVRRESGLGWYVGIVPMLSRLLFVSKVHGVAATFSHK
jgi:hypothetical protein